MDVPVPHRKRRSRWAGLAAIGSALVALTGFIGGIATGAVDEPSYRVEVAAPTELGDEGSHCTVSTMYVDQRTGTELVCQEGISPSPSAAKGSPFSPEERSEVLTLAVDLAGDGSLDDADRLRLTELGAEIGRRHGDVDRSQGAWPRSFGVVAAVGLVGCLVVVLSGAVRRLLGWIGRAA